jgi:D-xylose transport system substrate-binding protein
MRELRRVGALALLLVVVGVAGGCSSTSSGSLSSSSSASNGSSNLSATSFTSDYSRLSSLKSLAAEGTGEVGVLLPGAASSARYATFDAPDITRACLSAGISASDCVVSDDPSELTQAEADISAGAHVLILDAPSPAVGVAIESYASKHGVKVVDYDTLTAGGDREYYVSFNDVKVGNLIGQGVVECISQWGVSRPQVLELDGAPTDETATSLAQGYNAVLTQYFVRGTYTKVAEVGVPNWDGQQAMSIFEQQYSAHPRVDAVVAADDGLANAAISVLKSANVAARRVPVTGQGATLQGMQNILSGYQCGTVYEPLYLEAQAAMALALFLRAGTTPPPALVNGTTTDPASRVPVPSVLLPPVWVTTANMESTVVKDGFEQAAQICAGATATLCAQYGIH